jgi:hypothetical protein
MTDRDEILVDLDAPLSPVVGRLGEVQPDGSAELHLTDEGRRLFGESVKVIVVNAGPPAADTPVEVPAP